MSWLIGYKTGESGELKQLRVNVDEATPKDHYLMLYDLETTDPPKADEDSDVVEVKPEQLAHVRGYFSPAAWVFAVKDDIVILNVPAPDAESDEAA